MKDLIYFKLHKKNPLYVIIMKKNIDIKTIVIKSKFVWQVDLVIS